MRLCLGPVWLVRKQVEWGRIESHRDSFILAQLARSWPYSQRNESARFEIWPDVKFLFILTGPGNQLGPKSTPLTFNRPRNQTLSLVFGIQSQRRLETRRRREAELAARPGAGGREAMRRRREVTGWRGGTSSTTTASRFSSAGSTAFSPVSAARSSFSSPVHAFLVLVVVLGPTSIVLPLSSTYLLWDKLFLFLSCPCVPRPRGRSWSY